MSAPYDPWNVRITSRHVPAERRLEAALVQRHNVPIQLKELAEMTRVPRPEARSLTVKSDKFKRVWFDHLPGIWIALREDPK